MKKLILALVLLTTLSACTSDKPFYVEKNYRKQDWATMPFDQSKAACRESSLEHDELWDVYELKAPVYKACMEKNGYKFSAI
jgi:Prokaryotic membrane lipoprotein lipid attachment site